MRDRSGEVEWPRPRAAMCRSPGECQNPTFAYSDEKPLTIGLLSELSGPFARLGEDCRRGYEVARAKFAPADKAGGTAVRFVFGDNRGEAKTGLSEYQRMVEIEGASAIVTTRTPVAMALSPRSREGRISLVAPIAHPNFVDQNPYVFRLWPAARHEGAALADLAATIGSKQAAMISVQDDYFLSVGKSFREKFEAGGGKVLLDEQLLPTETDPSALISKLRTKHIDSILLFLTPPQINAFARRIREQGMKQQLYSTFVIALPDVLSGSGEAIEGALMVEPDVRHGEFGKMSIAQFGEERFSPIGYSCYAGLALLLQAAAQDPGAKDSQTLFKAVEKVQTIRLPDGDLEMEGREVQLPLARRIIKHGAVAAWPPTKAD